MRDLRSEELGVGKRRLVDEHRHPLGLHALHDALDGARAEVVRARLHREAVDAHQGTLNPLDSLQDLLGHEVLAGAVRLHDGGHQVLGDVGVVGEELLGVLGQAVSAVAE